MDNEKVDIDKKIFFSKYKPDKKIGEGSFGKIYSATNINSQEKYALKIENKNDSQNLLESEAYVLCYLKGLGIPGVKSYGYSGEVNVLVMELLGKSLEDLFQECGGRFSLKTVCMIAVQMIDRIEYVHSKHIIHRDIKPDNFVVGIEENKNIIYIIDFGLAKKYRSSRTLQHISFRNNKKLTGTARYASINALRGYEQSRRDDLEAIGYVLIYFLRGSLPWQGLKVDRKEDRYKKIYDKKKSTSPEELTQGFPSKLRVNLAEFCEYIKYTRGMGFEQNPDYEWLRGLFRKVMSKEKYSFDYQYDWSSKEQNKIPTNSTFNTFEANVLITNATDQNNNANKEYFEIENDNSNQINDEGVNKPNKLLHCDMKPKFIDSMENPPSIGLRQSTGKMALVQQKNVNIRYVPKEKERKTLNIIENKENIDYNIKTDNLNGEKKNTEDNKKVKKDEKKNKNKDCSFL